MKQNRKTKNKNAAFYAVISLMFAAVFLLAAPKQAGAAEKPNLSETQKTIGVGAYDAALARMWGGKDEACKNVISVYNAEKKASYSFVSKNKKVVTVKKKGAKCYITGVKAGKTTITCYQTLNKKKTVVGKCKVEVKNPETLIKDYTFPMGYDQSMCKEMYMETDDGIQSSQFYFNHMNTQADYEFVVDKPEMAIEYGAKSDEEGHKWFYAAYTVTKAGVYTVEIKETYKKKTRTVEKLKITVHEPEVKETYDSLVGDYIYDGNLLRYGAPIICHDTDDFDFDILDANNGQALYYDSDSGYFRALKAGTVPVKFYYLKSDGSKGDYIGTCTITVNNPKVKETLEIDVSDYGDGEYSNESISMPDFMEEYSSGASYKLAGEDFDIEDKDNGQPVYVNEYGSLYAVRPGTTTVGIYYWDSANEKMGDYIGSCTITVTVKEE